MNLKKMFALTLPLFPVLAGAKTIACLQFPGTYDSYVLKYNKLNPGTSSPAKFTAGAYTLITAAGLGSLSREGNIYTFELLQNIPVPATSVGKDPVLVGDKFVFQIGADGTRADGQWMRGENKIKDIACFPGK